MPDLCWVPVKLPGVADFVDGAGTIHGYVMPIESGRRGVAAYVILPGRKKGQQRSRFMNITQHPTDEAARAHVEAEVAQIYGGDGAA